MKGKVKTQKSVWSTQMQLILLISVWIKEKYPIDTIDQCLDKRETLYWFLILFFYYTNLQMYNCN